MQPLLNDKLAILAEDKIMLAALNELLNEKIEQARPIIDKGDNNELLGQKYRAYETAKKMANDTFYSITNFKKGDNPAPEFDKSK